eukprot:3941201-Rhodomonas_salina.3
MPGTDIAYGASFMPSYDPFTGTITPRCCYAMSGTGIEYGAVCLRACYAMSGTHLPFGTTDDDRGTNLEHVLGPALIVCSGINLEYLFSTAQGTAGDIRPGYATSLPECYAMSDTHIACAGIGVRAMSGTHMAYAATRLPSQMTEMHTPVPIPLRCCYAMSGTDIALCCSYAMSGTDISIYAARTRSPVLTCRLNKILRDVRFSNI